MPPPRLPPFTAVRAFEAAARLGSLKAAAAELCVTQSAVSHQLKRLESFTGRKLFMRKPGGVELSPDGARYLESATRAIDTLAAGTAELVRGDVGGVLKVRSTPGFANRWLIPRLSRFRGCHPHLDLEISTGMPPADFGSACCDVLIHWKDAPLQGAIVEPFFASIRFAVASPKLINGRMPRHPCEFQDFTILHDVHGDAWEAYMSMAGGVEFDYGRGPRFEHCDLTLAAVEAGQGVALGYALLADELLRQERLVRLLDLEVGPYLMHSLAYDARRTDCPRISAFRDWILAEAGQQEREVEGAFRSAAPQLRAV